MSNTQSPAPGVAAEAWNELRSIRAGLDARINLNSNYGCVGCGQWNPHGHKEGHGHDDGCPELARVIAESDARTRLDALLAALQASAAAMEGVNQHPTIATVCNYETEGPIQYFQLAGGDPLPLGTKLYTAPPLPAQVQAVEDIEKLAKSIGSGFYKNRADLSDYSVTFTREKLEEFSAVLASRTPVPGMAGGVGAHPLVTAPKDGTIVRLLVEFEEHQLEDREGPQWTIGANSGDNTGVDEWEFAGWSWEQDCFWNGVGKPLGWLPFAAPHPAPAVQVAGAEPVSFYSLPLGTRFSYKPDSEVWVILERHGTGLVAKWDGVIENYVGQSIASAENTEKETRALKVYVRDAIGAVGRAGS